MILDLALLPHQADFVEDCTTESLALVGGYGAGKTKALATKLIVLSLQNAGFEGIALSPTYGMSKRVLIPEIEEQLIKYNIPYTFLKGDMLFLIQASKSKTTKLHVMAAESYKRAAGINAAFFGVDEMDLIEPSLAREAWRMLKSRLRKGTVLQGCAVSTPEGYNFLYEYFEKEPQDDPELAADRRLIRARTADNPFNPPGYIDNLRAQYPEQMLEAYLNGMFVSLKGSPVYSSYEVAANNTELTWEELHKDIPLHLGIDFNNNAMSCVTAYIAQNKAYVVDELMGHKNTMALINAIRTKYGDKRTIFVYPDASGAAEKSSASSSDIEQLAAAGFHIEAHKANPRVKNRVSSVNARFANGQKPPQRALYVNRKTCKKLVKALLQQTYKPDGSPVKDGVVDGPVDALGYLVYKLWPIADRYAFAQASIAA